MNDLARGMGYVGQTGPQQKGHITKQVLIQRVES